MKRILASFAGVVILFSSVAVFSQQDSETVTTVKENSENKDTSTVQTAGPAMIEGYGTLGFTISGEKHMPPNRDLKPAPALGYSGGGTVGYRIIDEFSPMFHCEFSGRNHKYHNYKFFGENESIHWKTYFVSIMGGLRYWMNDIYMEPGVYFGFPVLDWKYRYVDESSVPSIDTKRDVAKKRQQKDIGLYLMIGSIIPIQDNICVDAGLQAHFGITRTLNDKSINTDIESANRLYMSFRMGIMARI